MLTTMIALAATATAAQTPAPAPAAAPADLPAWVEQVNRQIDAHMVRPDNGESGMATVTFRRGEDGRPVEVKAKGASLEVSRAAIRTIKLAGVLPPMPASMPGNQRISFHFLVGMPGHVDEYEDARTRMIASATRSNTELAARLGSRVQVAGLERR